MSPSPAEGMPAAYDRALAALIDEAQRDPEVVALLLTGSLARRDALPGTDIDLRSIVTRGRKPSFVRERREGIAVEHGFLTEADASSALRARPMHIYAYLDGVPLLDRAGALLRLHADAVRAFEDYRVPRTERRRLRDELSHPLDKLRTALAAGDLLRATFVLSTCSWQLLEGIWAANGVPLPPNSSVRPHLGDLDGPADAAGWFERLFLGDASVRAETGVVLLEWTVDALEQSAAPPPIPRIN